MDYVIWAPITAVLGTMFSEIFSAEVRYTRISLGYQIGAAVAGALLRSLKRIINKV